MGVIMGFAPLARREGVADTEPRLEGAGLERLLESLLLPAADGGRTMGSDPRDFLLCALVASWLDLIGMR